MSRGKLKNVLWGKTLQINLVRAFVAGLLMSLFAATQGESVETIVAMPFVVALIWFPIVLILNFLAHVGIPFVGLVGIVFALPFFVADPIVFVLHKVAPRLVPTESYGFINFTSLFLVTGSEQLA